MLNQTLPQPQSEKSYLSSKVVNATPLQLVVLVFEGLFRAIRETEEYIRSGNMEGYYKESERAIDIISELFSSLDFSVDMSRDLGAIYFFCKNHMVLARIGKNAEVWEQTIRILTPVYEGFLEISKREKLELEAKTNEQANNKTNLFEPKREPAILAGMTYGKGALNEFILNKKYGLRA